MAKPHWLMCSSPLSKLDDAPGRPAILAAPDSLPAPAMPEIHYTLLDEPLWPLMNKFYRAHQSSMKAVRDAQLWVARQDDIVAALCLRQVAGGHWLTGLFVDPAYRAQGIAARLIAEAVKAVQAPVWLFCNPDLREFYERRGFSFDPALPYAMAERLSRYARSKPMIAMGLVPPS